MRSYKEILRFLIIREQLSLGWKMGFFIVCGGLVYGALSIGGVRVRSAEVQGTVVSDRADLRDGAPVASLTVRLDSGATVHANVAGTTEYRPGRRVVVKHTTTNFFGIEKNEVAGYLDEARHE